MDLIQIEQILRRIIEDNKKIIVENDKIIAALNKVPKNRVESRVTK